MIEAKVEKPLPGDVLARALPIFAPVALIAILVFYLLYATQMSATQQVIASDRGLDLLQHDVVIFSEPALKALCEVLAR